MSITEVFYAVAIVYMVVTTIVLVSIAFFVIKVVLAIQKTKVELVSKLQSFQIAKYSLQLSLLRNILSFFGYGKGGDR